MDLSKQQIESVRQNAVLSEELSQSLDDAELLDKPVEALTQDDWDALHDAAMDSLLSNNHLVVEQFGTEGRFGRFPIQVVGIPGVYFVSAPDFDDKGFFSTVQAAIDWINFEFLTLVDRSDSAAATR